MHIVFAHRSHPPEGGWGGVGTYNYHTARALQRLGHCVTVIASRTDTGVPSVQDADGIRVFRLKVRDPYYVRQLPWLGRYVRSVEQLIYSARVNRALRRIHAQQPIDVVEFAEINAEGFFYARAQLSPFVVRCHTPTLVLKRYFEPREFPFDSRIIEWCEKKNIREARALTAPSNDLAGIIAGEFGLPPESIHVIPNALPLEGFTDSDQPHPLSRDGSPNILFVGRLERVKGILVLVQAIPHVIRHIPNAQFTIVGYDRNTPRGTSQQAELETMLEAAGVRENAEFLVGLDQDALMARYRRADVCVAPSMVYESFSYTCAQAMAAGKPVVASRIGGIPETVDDGVSGILVTPGDVDELADAVIALVRDPVGRARMGRAGRDKVAREFDPLRVAHMNLEIYERAVQKFQRTRAA